MSPDVRLAAVSVDTDDPKPVSEFYRQLLGLEVFFESDAFVALKGAALLLTFQRVGAHRAPAWPDGDVPKQLHLELSVSDLDAVERRALDLGATKPAKQPGAQPGGDRWRVLLDPAGHPFCLSTMIPEP